jgi:hypothetical protein
MNAVPVNRPALALCESQTSDYVFCYDIFVERDCGNGILKHFDSYRRHAPAHVEALFRLTAYRNHRAVRGI